MKNCDKEEKVLNWPRPPFRRDSSTNIRIYSYLRRARSTISSKTVANSLVCDKSPLEHNPLVAEARTETPQINNLGKDPNRTKSSSPKISQSCTFIDLQP